MKKVFNFKGSKHLLLEINHKGKDFKIQNFKSHAIIEFKDFFENYNIGINIGGINELIFKASEIVELTSTKQFHYLKDVKNFKIDPNRSLLLIKLNK